MAPIRPVAWEAEVCFRAGLDRKSRGSSRAEPNGGSLHHARHQATARADPARPIAADKACVHPTPAAEQSSDVLPAVGDSNVEVFCQVPKYTDNLHVANLVVEAEYNRLQSISEHSRPSLLPCPTATAIHVVPGLFALQQYLHKILSVAFSPPHPAS